MAEEQSKQTPNGGPGQNEEFDPSKINEHVKKLSHKLPTGHQPYKVVVRPSTSSAFFWPKRKAPKCWLYLVHRAASLVIPTPMVVGKAGGT